MTKFLYGQPVAEKILKTIPRGPKEPFLAIIVVGKDRESQVYIREKQKKARDLKIKTKLYRFDANINQSILIDVIEKLNQDQKVDGILVQLPLPQTLNANAVIEAVDLKKDVDGLRKNSPYPPTCATAIVKILSHYKINLQEKKIVIVGVGRLVGQPLYKIFRKKNYRVVLIRSREPKSVEIIKNADVVVGAARRKNFISPKMIKSGAVVIDAASNCQNEAIKKAGSATPKYGGVGPVTVAVLLKNVAKARGLDPHTNV
ncbi:MAG: bifunctional 5,10-methylenetetrahydrofolate dehydrogenase/5,10-methenyltetrahydrofolate cyclohydrolase [Thermoplasmata archaeon]|nr:bifunctional 5,10-methylenetetrahydrofolate dehydrogenase/5,10-methenyltetrahydrofolate cyclohydrolase [Thermoplasmata archaeon]